MTRRGEVVGTDLLERALEGPAERRAGGRDDDGFGHGGSPGAASTARAAVRRATKRLLSPHDGRTSSHRLDRPPAMTCVSPERTRVRCVPTDRVRPRGRRMRPLGWTSALPRRPGLDTHPGPSDRSGGSSTMKTITTRVVAVSGAIAISLGAAACSKSETPATGASARARTSASTPAASPSTAASAPVASRDPRQGQDERARRDVGRLRRQVDQSGKTIKIDFKGTSDGKTADITIEMEGDGKARVISVGDGVYIQGDETFWKKQGAPASGARRPGTSSSRRRPRPASMTQSLSLKSLPREGLRRGHAAASWPRTSRARTSAASTAGSSPTRRARRRARSTSRRTSSRSSASPAPSPARASSTSPSGTRTSASRRPSQPGARRSADLQPRHARGRPRTQRADAFVVWPALRLRQCVDCQRAGVLGGRHRRTSRGRRRCAGDGRPWRRRGRRHGRADAVQQDGPASLAPAGLAADLGRSDLGAGLGDGPRRRLGERADALAAPRVGLGRGACARRRGRARR